MAKRIYTIPVNYDEGKLKIFGYFSIRNLVESLIFTAVTGTIAYIICSLFGQKLLGGMLIAILFIAFTLVGAFAFGPKTLGQTVLQFIGFGRTKKVLKFRRVQKRIRPYKKGIEKANGSKGHRKGPIRPHKKKGVFYGLADDVVKQLSSSSDLKDKKERYTQEMVPIKSIEDGIVITKDGHYVKVLEFTSSNFLNKDDDTQAAIINSFTAFNKSSPVTVQWKVRVIKTDVGLFLDNVDSRLKEERDDRVRRFGEGLKALVLKKSFTSNIDQRYFLILRYEPKGGLFTKEGKKESIDNLERYVSNAINIMRRCRNQYVFHKNENAFLYAFYYDFFNRFSSEHERVYSRVHRVVKDTKRIKGIDADAPVPAIKPHNVIAPRGMDLSRPSYMTMDGLYYSYLVISDFPTEVLGGWLSIFFSFGPDYDFDIFLKREDRSHMLEKVGRKISAKEGDISVMPEQSVAAQELKKAYAWDMEIQRSLMNGHDFFYMMIIVTVCDRDHKRMIAKRDAMKAYMHEKGLKAEVPRFDVERFFKTSIPVCLPDKDLFDTYKRNVLTDGAAALYPLTVSSIKDFSGIPIGTEIGSNAPIIYDPFNTKKRASANGYIMGITGYGKTYLTMLMAFRLRILQTQVFVIAPIKGFEYDAMCSAVGGVRIPIGPSYSNCINIMQITPVDAADALLLKDDVTFDPDRSYVSEKVDEQLVPFFEMIMPDLRKGEKDQLNSLLVRLYEDHGMYADDNDSIYIDGDPAKGSKTMPTISDVYDRLKDHKNARMRALSEYLEAYVNGTYRCFNGQTNVSMDNKLIVFDLDPIVNNEDTFKVGIYIVQNFVWRSVKMGRLQKKCILYDEAWKMLNIKQAAATMKEVYKTIRGFRGFAVASTQQYTDLISTPEGRAIAACSTFQGLFRQNVEEARALQAGLGLSDEERTELINLERGEALIRIDDEPFFVKVEASFEEDGLFQTDAGKLEEQRKEGGSSGT